ncbi:hypothetical protein KAI87_10960, partial [Myxococcota bacterium]|nr:hypothetical protein [Myxococcota bacterium]
KPFAGRVLQIPPRHPKYYLGLRSLLSKRLVKALREASVELHLWTINDMHEARSYLDKGVQGIITDDPASLANLLWNRQNKADS